jgi:hypothetical protein
MNIQRNYSPLMIQFKKGRSASAWWPPRRPLQNPLILDQIFDDQRDRAPLQARDSRKVRTRKRLTRSHQIEYQVPINLSRCFVRRTLPASESEPSVGHRLAFVSHKISKPNHIKPRVLSNSSVRLSLEPNSSRSLLDVFGDESLYHCRYSIL